MYMYVYIQLYLTNYNLKHQKLILSSEHRKTNYLLIIQEQAKKI